MTSRIILGALALLATVPACSDDAQRAFRVAARAEARMGAAGQAVASDAIAVARARHPSTDDFGVDLRFDLRQTTLTVALDPAWAAANDLEDAALSIRFAGSVPHVYTLPVPGLVGAADGTPTVAIRERALEAHLDLGATIHGDVGGEPIVARGKLIADLDPNGDGASHVELLDWILKARHSTVMALHGREPRPIAPPAAPLIDDLTLYFQGTLARASHVADGDGRREVLERLGEVAVLVDTRAAPDALGADQAHNAGVRIYAHGSTAALPLAVRDRFPLDGELSLDAWYIDSDRWGAVLTGASIDGAATPWTAAVRLGPDGGGIIAAVHTPLGRVDVEAALDEATGALKGCVALGDPPTSELAPALTPIDREARVGGPDDDHLLRFCFGGDERAAAAAPGASSSRAVLAQAVAGRLVAHLRTGTSAHAGGSALGCDRSATPGPADPVCDDVPSAGAVRR